MEIISTRSANLTGPIEHAGEAFIPRNNKNARAHIGTVFQHADGTMEIKAEAYPQPGENMTIEFDTPQPSTTSDVAAVVDRNGPHSVRFEIGVAEISGTRGTIRFFGIPRFGAALTFDCSLRQVTPVSLVAS